MSTAQYCDTLKSKVDATVEPSVWQTPFLLGASHTMYDMILWMQENNENELVWLYIEFLSFPWIIKKYIKKSSNIFFASSKGSSSPVEEEYMPL